MRNGYFFLFLAFGCLMGCRCQKAATVVPAPDGLYQRWKAENADQYIIFLHEGILLRGKDGKQVSCCAGPSYFRRDGMTLIFKDVPAKPLPFELPSPTDCAYVLCGRVEPLDWHIVSLTPDRLILNTGYGIDQTYVAAP